MGKGVHIATLVILTIALLLAVVATFTPYWKVNDPSTTNMDTIVSHEGLWLQCTTFNTGTWACDDYNIFFLALPTKLQAARGLAISALIMGLAAIVATIPTVCGGLCGFTGKEVYLLAAAGTFTFIAAICMIAAPSWYAKGLYDEYYFQYNRNGGNMQNAGRVMIFGSALFIGWVSGALFVLAAFLTCGALLCCTPTPSEERREPYRMEPYRSERINTVNKSMTEYV